MKARTVVALVATALVLAGVACRKPTSPAEDPTAQTQEPTPPPERVVLFFVDAEGRLQRETRQVPELPAGEQARIRLILDELILGSRQGLTSPFPWPTSVKTVFVGSHGTAFVDLTPAPPPGSVMGTNMEAALVYALVSTVVANCHGIERVQLLFDGREVETLGHLDLSHPLQPQTGLVAP